MTLSAMSRSPYQCEPYVRVWKRAAVDEATARGNSHDSLSPFHANLGSRGAPASVPTEVSCNAENGVIGSWLHETCLASRQTRAWVRSPLGEFSRFVFSPGVVEPVPEVERVPLKKKTLAMSSASEAVKKTLITVRAGSDRITISTSPRRGLTRLAIDGAQHSHDEVRSENHTHKRAPDAGA
ncbi:unnamed protein product [Trichogramma brassicae]|uniref:Uncharacterized protein n=1 Tax=Trichogramma brassicae TaxID=86971 RepID=A0A6H5J3Z6_9HYME|nr:unnamed protein product [Trichogramma brassicae]